MMRELLQGTLLMLFNVVLLSMIYHFFGLDTVIIFGFAKIITDVWRGEIKRGTTKTLRS